jgi:hypothetical protein
VRPDVPDVNQEATMLDMLWTKLNEILANPQTMVNSVSAFVAALAFLLAIYTGIVARRHYRTSVRPLLVLNFDQMPINGDKANVDWKVSNCGLGPAIIRKYELRLDGKLINTASMADRTRAAFRLFGFVLDQQLMLHLARGDLIRKDQDLSIFTAEMPTAKLPDIKKVDDLDRLSRLMERLSVYIEYESLYGKHYWLPTLSRWARIVRRWKSFGRKEELGLRASIDTKVRTT